MAILRGPYGTTQIKGSIGATTFQAGQYGLIARSRTVPVNPGTPRQSQVRDAMNVASTIWNTIAAAPDQYAAWTNYASLTSWLNHLGDPIHLAARTHFLRIASFLLAGGVDIGDLPLGPPPIPGVPSPGVVTYTVDTTDGFKLIDSEPPLATDDMTLVQIGGPTGPARYFFKGPFAISSYVTQDTTFPLVVIPAANVAVGQRYFITQRTYRNNATEGNQGLSVVSRDFIDVVA